MDIEQKVYENLRQQFVVAMRIEKFRSQLRQQEQEHQALVGAIGAWSEMYAEQTGRDMQQDVNSDPRWKAKIEQARTEAEKIVAKEVSGPPEESAVEQKQQLNGAADQPMLRKVTSNKQAAEKGSTGRSRKPVNVVIDDNPPTITDDEDTD